MTTPAGQEQKSVFWALHAFRGLAAVCISLFHIGYDVRNLPFVPLLVDFFFLLSGFILSCSYDERLRSGALSSGRFVKQRLIRLYPLYLLGIVLVFPEVVMYWLVGMPNYEGLYFWPAFVANAVFLPSPFHVGAVHYDQLYPMNMVAWSLAVELVVNLAYAYMFFWMTGRKLIYWLVGFGILQVIITMHYNMVDLGAYWASIESGYVRGFFSFFCGVGLARLHRYNPERSVEGWVALLMAGLLIGLVNVEIFHVLYPLLCVFVLLPLMVWILAAVKVPPKWVGFCEFLGNASYPYYVIHVHVFGMLAALYVALGIDMGDMENPRFVLWPLGTLLLAWLVAKYYDTPVRRWLTHRTTVIDVP